MCYNVLMLSKVSRATVSILGVGALAVLANINISPAFASNPDPENINFKANVKEALSVSITVPEDWASGDIDTLLRNKVILNVHSNNADGFTASMTTNDENTYLAHTTIEPDSDNLKINTLQSNWTRSDTTTTDFWGYSINDNDENGTYSPLVAKGSGPITLISRTDSIDADNPITSRDIYFGAKASTAKVAGTYSKTVVISVVSGITTPDDPTDPNNNPVIPNDPVTPESNPGASDQTANPSYSTTYDRTAYTYTTTGSGESTTTTNINEGDVISSYERPHGVKDTSKKSTDGNGSDNGADNTVLTAVLATTAAVAAGAGTLFFILAKRKNDDE